MGLVRQINIPGLRIQRMFSWALPSGELGGAFYQFANSIRSELSTVSVSPLKEAPKEPKRESWVREGNCPPERSRPSIVLADMRSEHPIYP
jgi:hypothetical protein